MLVALCIVTTEVMSAKPDCDRHRDAACDRGGKDKSDEHDGGPGHRPTGPGPDLDCRPPDCCAEDEQCDDGDPCTTDECRGAVGCVHRPADVGRCSSDGLGCTMDVCRGGRCVHLPIDARCTAGECELAVCSPGDAVADEDGCVGVPVRDGEECTDDGVTCTDDVCRRGTCLHVPVDTRCAPPGTCMGAVCRPGRGAESACTVGPVRRDGEPCAEDGDPCTSDRCAAGVCSHALGDLERCVPVRDSFQRARALDGLARGTEAALGEVLSSDDPATDDLRGRLATPLVRIEERLTRAADVLAGRDFAATSAITTRVVTTTPSPFGLTAGQRARIAFTQVRDTPREVADFLAVVAAARTRATLSGEDSQTLRRRGRALLRGTRGLRADLRRLRREP